MKARWERWRGELPYLADIYIPRCYKDKDVDTSINVELHNFSDASLTGYGQCSFFAVDGQSRQYILCPSNGQIPCWPFKVCDHTASRDDCCSIVSQGWQLLAEIIGAIGTLHLSWICSAPFISKKKDGVRRKMGSSFHVHGQPGCAYRNGKLSVNGFIHQCLPTFRRTTWTHQTAALLPRYQFRGSPLWTWGSFGWNEWWKDHRRTAEIKMWLGDLQPRHSSWLWGAPLTE